MARIKDEIVVAYEDSIESLLLARNVVEDAIDSLTVVSELGDPTAKEALQKLGDIYEKLGDTLDELDGNMM